MCPVETKSLEKTFHMNAVRNRLATILKIKETHRTCSPKTPLARSALFFV